jgi:drug/metabolite transporter (DMT)-like permease
MFFVFALISMASYALHNVLMAPYYRRNDQLAMVTLRGLGMSLAMVPGLLVVGSAGWAAVGGQLPWLLGASAAALLGNWAAANAVRHLPIGIATALNMSLSTVVASGLGLWLLDETLTLAQLGWMSLIFLGVFGLGAVRRPPITTITVSLSRGLMFSWVFGLALGVGFTLISRVSRSLEPLMAGWCWEFLITLMGAGVLLLRRGAYGHIGSVPPRRELGRIFVFCIPGAVGTSCYALAVASGPVAIVAAILGTMMVAASILAWLFHGERLSGGQWLFVAVVCLAVMGLRSAAG